MTRSLFCARIPRALLGLGAAALFAVPGTLSAQQPAAAVLPAARSMPAADAAVPIAQQPAAPAPAVSPAPPGVAYVPAPPAAAGADGAGCTDGQPKSAWLSYPRVQFIPPPGFFPVPPTGPGYYSALDMATGNWREKAPSSGYPRSAIMPFSFFDADFRYVDQPGYCPDILERLHRIHLGDDWMFATGGEFRWRLANEVNSRLSGKDNNYDLTRLRIFGDLWYRDVFRFYGEFISAQTFNQDLAPLIIDRNYADIQNLFIDLKFFEDGYGIPYYVRAGRQEMLLGSQRLVSPLDWANTRRTFDGVRAFRHGDKFDVDAFWVRPVIPNPSRLDHSDPEQNFAGLFTEYRPSKTQVIDLYYFYLSNGDNFNFKTRVPVPVGQVPLAPYTVHTVGTRFYGNLNSFKNVLFDSENMLQFGRSGFTSSDVVAGAVSEGIGYNFAKAPMNPTVWAYFDYASGSRNIAPGNGAQFSTFNQLYPFGHYYFGWLDYVGRDNIQDWNFHLYLYPTKWITLNAQYHVFMLDSATDALYNAGGTILRYDPTGKSGRDIGQELDLIANFHLTPRQDVLVAWGQLWEGRFLRSTGPGNSAQSFWLMYTVRW